ncbi:MAG: hypothetical protein K9I94_03685 [Bacteroidales bacterium]|nr:hypothetical protein [Bacteroidales bacterium]
MKKGNTPKRKRLSRKNRLNSGKKWLETYNGKHIVKGYSKWFGVDKICAIKELRMLGIEITEGYEEQIKRSIEDLTKERKWRKEQKEKENKIESEPWSDEMFAFIAGYTSNGVPSGITHEEMEAIDKEFV